MKILLTIMACVAIMTGCASTTRQMYGKAANDLVVDFVPKMINSIPMAFPGADHLAVREIILTQDNNFGIASVMAEDKDGKKIETIYLLIACAKLDDKHIGCVPASILTGFSINKIIQDRKYLLPPSATE